MVLALSTPELVFNVVLGVAIVIGWVVVAAIWWFVFRKAPKDGSELPFVVAGDAPEHDD
jgi:hypothetical protein